MAITSALRSIERGARSTRGSSLKAPRPIYAPSSGQYWKNGRINNGRVEADRDKPRKLMSKKEVNMRYQKINSDPKPQLPIWAYDNTNAHLMLGEVAFRLRGRFTDEGNQFAMDMKRAATEMGVVGFVRCREKIASGRIQGDAYAVSEAAKWLEHKYGQTQYNRIFSTKLRDEKLGIRETRYPDFGVVFDYRSPKTKQRQSNVHKGRTAANEALTEMVERTEMEKRFQDANYLPDF